MEIVQPPTSPFCRRIWIFLLLESPARAAEHLPGRYIQLPGWDSRLGGGGPSPLPHSSFPPLSQRPGPTSCGRKKSSVAARSRPACAGALPAPRLGDPLALPTGSFLSFPLLSTVQPSRARGPRGFQISQSFSAPSRRYPDAEIASGVTPLAAPRSAAGELPGRRPSCCRSGCFSLGLPAVWSWWRAARGLGWRRARRRLSRRRGKGGGQRGLRARAPGWSDERDLTARRRQEPPPPLPLPRERRRGGRRGMGGARRL